MNKRSIKSKTIGPKRLKRYIKTDWYLSIHIQCKEASLSIQRPSNIICGLKHYRGGGVVLSHHDPSCPIITLHWCVEYQFKQKTSTCLSFLFGKVFSCWTLFHLFNLKRLSFVSTLCFRLQKTLPAGRSFIAMDTKQIPQILQQIFTSTMLSSA